MAELKCSDGTIIQISAETERELRRAFSNLPLQKEWEQRKQMYAEGRKLCAEGHKLCAEGDTLYAEGRKLRAEGDKLCAEGSKLYAEGDILWCKAIIHKYGNCKIEWRHSDCHLENGDIYYG